jgi:tubulin polyglutamylase TTLL6/13
MYVLSRKNNLAKQLMKMYKKFPSYNFFPQTWVVPSDISDLRQQFNNKQNRTFIVKPEAACQGRGIFLIRRPNEIPTNEPLVVQKYLGRPYLIDGLKFDLRLYVLITGIEPLRVYLYKEGSLIILVNHRHGSIRHPTILSSYFFKSLKPISTSHQLFYSEPESVLPI